MLDTEETRLVDEHAEAALDCLYSFLHALEQRDVELAMSAISPDYHVMEEDLEVGRPELQARIERALEDVQGWEIEVALTTAPEPLFHPYGVLISADMQMDARRDETNERRTIIDRRVVWIQESEGGTWKIAALSPATRAR